MPLEAFIPPEAPSVGAQNKPKVSILKAEFGDGYVQTTAAGINHIRDTFSLTWEVLTAAQADYIDEFLRAKGGYTPFLYTVPGKSTPQKFTCEEWSETFIQAGLRRMTATFVQSFAITP